MSQKYYDVVLLTALTIYFNVNKSKVQKMITDNYLDGYFARYTN